MKINIPKVVIAVDLREYVDTAELAGKFFHVWVNPPKDKLQEYDNLVTTLQAKELDAAKKTLLPEPGEKGEEEKTGLARTFAQVSQWLKIKKESKSDGVDEKLLQWYADVWSCGPDETHWSVAELRELENQDPAFLSWMIARTWEERSKHIQAKKKS